MCNFALLWAEVLLNLYLIFLAIICQILPRHPDPRELFVPSSDHYEVIQLRTNWPTLLPCQVTSPEAKVSLHREFPPAEVAVNGADISFNVMKGFTIHRPRPHHAGALYCVASLGGLRQSSTKYMLIYVHCGCKRRRGSGRRADRASQLLRAVG